MASAIICLATTQMFNFSKFIFDSMIRNLDNVSGKFLMYPSSAIPTDPQPTSTIIPPSTQPQNKKQPRKPKRKDTQVPQPSGPTESIIDEAIHKELSDRLDAKKLLEAIEKRFGGNAATKKTQRNLLKQQYKNFTASSLEIFDQTFDRLQKLVSQLEILKKKLSQEYVNQKLLRSVSPEWNTHVVVWRNKAVLDKISIDDLYNNLKVYEPEVKGMSGSSSSTQNMVFMSSSNNNISSTNGEVNIAQAVNTAHEVSTSTQVNAPYSTNINNLSDVVIC
nr:hypothetical protein [Tanacetum cinerariifolium]